MNIQELISFRIDCFDLLTVQRTLKSLLQQHNLKASILQRSDFTVQLSPLYMTCQLTTKQANPLCLTAQHSAKEKLGQ